MSYKQDYEFGKLNENKILSTLRKFFNDDTIMQTTNKYNKYDFKSLKTNRKIELKSRQNFYNTFPTTIIPSDKLCHDVTLVFSFRDGDYYIDYDPVLFNTFESKLFVRNSRSDCIDRPNDYIYIPIEHLKRIEVN
jgi:hypothetical protein